MNVMNVLKIMGWTTAMLLSIVTYASAPGAFAEEAKQPEVWSLSQDEQDFLNYSNKQLKLPMKTQAVPSQATFTLALSKLIRGTSPVIANAKCTFTYNWNFGTNTGTAQLVSIDNCMLSIPLYPEGIEGILGFMSDLNPPSHVVINGQRVVLNRIILVIELNDASRMAAIAFNEDGSCLEATDNWIYGSEAPSKK